MENFERFSDNKLPDRSKFLVNNNLNNSLKDECNSEKDHLHVIDVWNMLKRRTIGGYYDLSLKTCFVTS